MLESFFAAALSVLDHGVRDGIHLLWTAPRGAGYSINGFDIQRRPTQIKQLQPDCEQLSPDALETLERDLILEARLLRLLLRSSTFAELFVEGGLADRARKSLSDAAPFIAHTPAKAALPCRIYAAELRAPHRNVRLTLGLREAFVIALRQGKGVLQRMVREPDAPQHLHLGNLEIDSILIYTAERLSELELCFDPTQSVEAEEEEWSGVPYLVQGLQLPVEGLAPDVFTRADAANLAVSRVIAGETLPESSFGQVSDVLRKSLDAAPGESPVFETLFQRNRAGQPFLEMGAWPLTSALYPNPMWRRVLGFGWLDKAAGLVRGQSYDYRISGRFRRRYLERLFGFQNVPWRTTLPSTVQFETFLLEFSKATIVDVAQDISDEVLRHTARKGVKLRVGETGFALRLHCPEPVTRIWLEFETDPSNTIVYDASAADLSLVESGSFPVSGLVQLRFPAPVTTISLKGNCFFYGFQVPDPFTGDAAELVTRSIVLSGVRHEASPPPAPPILATATSMQRPLVPDEPEVAARNSPQPIGMRVEWLPPLPAGSDSSGVWPADVASHPPSEAASYHVERRIVGSTSFGPVDEEDTVFFASRCGRVDPIVLSPGVDLTEAFSDSLNPVPPVSPLASLEDVLFSGERDVAAPGTMVQYRVWSVDIVGRRSLTPAVSTPTRLEKRLPPPIPPGPPRELDSPAMRGVRTRVLVEGDPELTRPDRRILRGARNAIVFEWGWTETERQLDPFAREFRLYFQPHPPDRKKCELVGEARSAGGLFEMDCTAGATIVTDELTGVYIQAGAFPFKAVSNSAASRAGERLVVRLEPSRLDSSRVPVASVFEFIAALHGEELDPADWPERIGVVPMRRSRDRYSFVLRNRLDLDSSHPFARVWLGVSAADRENYIPDRWRGRGTLGARQGNESRLAIATAIARYKGRPSFNVPPRLGAIPELVTEEPTGTPVRCVLELARLLPGVTLDGHKGILERLAISNLFGRLTPRDDFGVTILAPDRSLVSYAPANPEDAIVFIRQLQSGVPASVDNRFLRDLVIQRPAATEDLWEPTGIKIDSLTTISDAVPETAERQLYRVRLVDNAGHISEGAAVLPIAARVPSLRRPAAPAVTTTIQPDGTVSVTGHFLPSFDLAWLSVFYLSEATLGSPSADQRKLPEVLRVPNLRDRYPRDGIRLRLSSGVLLAPAESVPIPGFSGSTFQEVTVGLTVAAGRRLAIWLLLITRDGIPSPLQGPLMVVTPLPPPVVPPLTVTRRDGIATIHRASWPAVIFDGDLAVESSIDGGETWTRVSPWLSASASEFELRSSAGAVLLYRLVLRELAGRLTHGTATRPT